MESNPQIPRAEPRISLKDLERNKRFTPNYLKLIFSYDAEKSTEAAEKSKQSMPTEVINSTKPSTSQFSGC